METLLEFRRPQFSEDVAWLPAWLQRTDISSFDEPPQAQTPLEQRIENRNAGKDANMLSMDEGRYQSCHLFLSGEDNSPVSFATSSEKVAHFHLHLSLNSNSMNMPSPPLDTYQAEKLESNNVLSMQRAETSAHHEERENILKIGNKEDTGINNDENARRFNSADLSDVVELSIGASEALVIHEVIKSCSSTKSLPAFAILEVSLRVKQARLEALECNFDCPTENIYDIDCLSDLDESTMADAYEDVGLSESCYDGLHASDSIISRVEETPSSSVCYEEHIYERRRALAIGCVDISSKQQPRDVINIDIQERIDLALKSTDVGRESNLIDDPTLSLNPSSVACLDDHVLQWSVLANSDVPATIESVDFATMDTTSVPPGENLNSSPRVLSLENCEKDDKITNVVQERFQSRWFGGWTLKKEENASAIKKHDNARRVPKFLVVETSSLSESADIVPDENSFVHKQDRGTHMASQSSIQFEGLCNKLNESTMISPDVVRSSSLSLVDPLCSVVPCSLSSENAFSSQEHRPNDKIDAEKCFTPVPIDMGEGYKATVSRQLTSLRTYSVGTTRNLFVEKGSIYCNNSKQLEPNSRIFPSQPNSCSFGGIGKNHSILYSNGPSSIFSNRKPNIDGSSKDGDELQDHVQNERSSPLILNRGTCHRFQASKIVKKGDPPLVLVPQSDVLFQQRNNFQIRQSECNISHRIEAPARKRVRFSESVKKFRQKTNLHDFQFTCGNGSTGRASKRLKSSNMQSESKAQAVKRSRTNCPIKDAKRMIFRDIEFLLTGFSSQKETEIVGLIRKYGGMVLSDIPAPPNSREKRSSKFSCQKLPLVLCPRKLETIEFLYGCAVNACVIKVNWLTDSIAADSVLPPQKYMILSNHVGSKCVRIGKPQRRNKYMFDGVGILLHGKHSFCTKLAKVVKHGGGQVFKTLQWLVQSIDAQKISVGAIVAEDESRASRHLKQCASEQNIPMMPASWIINSLLDGKLIPFMENNRCSLSPGIKIPVSMELSQEI